MTIRGLIATGAVVRNSLRLEPDHFRNNLTRADALDLFKKSVELIEYETTAYCNRVCSFCPNSFLDRRTVRKMPEEVWRTILANLDEIDYDGAVVWSRYAEATSEERLPDRIRQVRNAAPKCRIAVNSNGDYLNAKYLEDLADAGLDRLWIDTYFDDATPPSEEACMAANDKLLKRLNLAGRLVNVDPEYVWEIPHPTIEITSHVRNATTMVTNLSDRGGLISTARKTVRTAPCYAVYKHLVIDWDGSVMPCCQLRSDSPEHRSAIASKIGEDGEDLITAYVALAKWRKALADFGPKQGVCHGCNVSEYEASRLNVSASRMLMNVDSPLVRALKRVVRPLVGKQRRY
jgi:MoaA/NifB/PqqE/SkfB family radical SAM enzyme